MKWFLIITASVVLFIGFLLVTGIVKVQLNVNWNNPDNSGKLTDTLYVANGDIYCINTIEASSSASLEKLAYDKAAEKVLSTVDDLSQYATTCDSSFAHQLKYEKIGSKTFVNDDSTRFACRVAIVVHKKS